MLEPRTVYAVVISDPSGLFSTLAGNPVVWYSDEQDALDAAALVGGTIIAASGVATGS